jgi:hypothetical protein
MFLWFLVSSALLSRKDVEFCQGLSSAFIEIFIFCLFSCLCAEYIYLFACVEPLLHPWNKTNLIMIDDLSNVWLNLVCKYFKNFCI